MNRLKELRRAKGLTQEEIARLLGVQKAAICKYETGRVAIPPDTLVVLCDFFGVTADYMLCREEPVLVSPQFKPTASLSPRFHPVSDAVGVPLVGCVHAGLPMLAAENISEYVPVPAADVQGVHDINLTVCKDDYLGIIGPNGGGKTTLMRLILGLMKPTDGSIRFYKDGEEVREISMGYLPQYNHLDKQFPISVYEVVLSGLSKTKSLFSRYTQAQHQQVLDCLEQMQLTELKDRHIAALSGGQLQRVLLARAIVSKPDVVILDEPNTYIDRRFQKQMYEMLEQINRECAIIIVSHDVAEVLNNVKHIACVNHHLHYHDTADMPREKLEEHFLNV